jgi:hypothetical protein
VSKQTSPRAAPIDWQALRKVVEDSPVPYDPQAQRLLPKSATESQIKALASMDEARAVLGIADPARKIPARYIRALEMSIVKGDHALLIELIEGGIPIHPALYPALAVALREMSSRRPGRPVALVSDEKIRIRALYEFLTRSGRLRREAAVLELHVELGISESTIRRALGKKK